jgi:hypothetical protein
MAPVGDATKITEANAGGPRQFPLIKRRQIKPMKIIFGSITVGLLAMTFLTGCLVIGGGTKSETQKPTVGKQLIDLQKAKDSGAITDAEYHAQKARLLDSK